MIWNQTSKNITFHWIGTEQIQTQYPEIYTQAYTTNY